MSLSEISLITGSCGQDIPDCPAEIDGTTVQLKLLMST
jgi:hypothetical protein